MKRSQLEALYAGSLLRAPGESAEAPLERLGALLVQPGVTDLRTQAQKIVRLAYKHARSERSVSPKLAAQQTNIPESTLLEWVEQADPDAFSFYAELLIEHQKADQLASAAEEAVEKARGGKSLEALDTLSDQIAALQAASEDGAIVSLHEGTERFLKWYETYQAEMKSGKVRWSFQSEKLDDMVPYIFPGHAILITASSKVGKSSLCQQWFDFNIRRGLKGLFFHFEDSPEVMGIKRTARQMVTVKQDGQITGLSQKKLLRDILTAREKDLVSFVNSEVFRWNDNGKFVDCAGWTMEQVARTCWRYKDWMDFFVVDYIGKEFFPPGKLRNWGGQYGAAAFDAELVKTTAQRLKKVAIVVQQEHDDGRIFGTKQTWQKFQVWISLSRERLENQSLSGTYREDIGDPGKGRDGTITVRNANMGETGEIDAWFYPEFGLWAT